MMTRPVSRLRGCGTDPHQSPIWLAGPAIRVVEAILTPSNPAQELLDLPILGMLKISSDGQCAVVWRGLDMNIGEVAKASGVSAKRIRHYEEAGLIQAAMWTESNYRVYTRKDVEVLRFVKQARRLGFSMKQISALLGLWENRSRPSSEVKRLAQEHIAELDLRIRDLTEMRDTLDHLAQHWRGDSRPECPILEELAGQRN
jgi:MerR family copper efflux transcriptional regulator